MNWKEIRKYIGNIINCVPVTEPYQTVWYFTVNNDYFHLTVNAPDIVNLVKKSKTVVFDLKKPTKKELSEYILKYVKPLKDAR